MTDKNDIEMQEIIQRFEELEKRLENMRREINYIRMISYSNTENLCLHEYVFKACNSEINYFCRLCGKYNENIYI